jgi:predicted TIM-barrel fold metal-dependent hydrolase
VGQTQAILMKRRRIDVHHHILPPAYTAWLRTQGIDAGGGRPLPDWSLDATLRLMDEQDIASAIVSVSAPGVHLDPTKRADPVARAKAREVNEFAAELARTHPARFGFVAMLPRPDIDGALEEAVHALDTLGAAGVVLLANTHGHYVGEADDEPLLAELNRRRAVVFVHPNALPGPPIAGIPPFAADFLLDTTRAAYQLVASGAMQRYPDLKIILSHAGGFVPYASHRLALTLTIQTQRSVPELLDDLARFYFDTAISGTPAALPSLLAFAKPGHVLFGSDWPFMPAVAIGYITGQLEVYGALDADGHAVIDRRSAERLFPQLAT